jgi:hypothetical protein
LFVVKIEASDGKPPCCLFFKDDFPPGLMGAFGTANPMEFKILGTIENIGVNKIELQVTTIISKTMIKDIKDKRETMELYFPEGILNIMEIKKGDYFLLIPTKFYNPELPDNMYDFIKIPRRND